MRIGIFYKNNKGFTLPEVLIAALIMGGIAVGLAFLMKQQTQQTVKSKTDADIIQLRSEILSTLTSPNGCNANFYGFGPGPTAVLNFKVCGVAAVGSCRPGGTNKIPVVTTSWSPTTTKISDRVRITALSITVQSATPAGAIPAVLTTGTLTATVESRGSIATGAPSKTENLIFQVPVVFNGATVTGCPKSWNTTLVN